MTKNQDLRVLITGASSGIGKATALTFAQTGAMVGLIGRDSQRLESLMQAIEGQGGRAIMARIDLSQLAEIGAQLDAVVAKMGGVDVLINNAGMAYTGPLGEMSLTNWQRVIDLNLTSVFECTKVVLPGMRDRRSGTIVNVISVAGHQTFPEWGAYCASKFGLLGFTKTLAQEERAHGIRVIALCPGSVNTPLWDQEMVQADFDRSAMLMPEDVATVICQAVSLPSHAVVEELVLMPNVGTF
jgi:short-subunit dehydrogenase